MKLLFNNITRLLVVLVLVCTGTLVAQQSQPQDTRKQLVAAILSTGNEQRELVKQLVNAEDVPLTRNILTLWKAGSVLIQTDASGAKIPYIVENEKPLRIDDGKPLDGASGQAVETDGALRKAISNTLTLLSIADPDPKERLKAVNKLGPMQKTEYLPTYSARLAKEQDAAVKYSLNEAIAMAQLVDPSPAVQTAAIVKLGDLCSMRSVDMLKKFSEDASIKERQDAAIGALTKLNNYKRTSQTFATVFRGISYGSVLLVAALGLAITFGLMGVINMAHGELMVVGAYSVYVMEGWFSRAFGAVGLEWYFIFAIPFAFLNAAIVGLILERSVIRFLYNRPLESLLATWGVSLVLQQTFRYVFGSNNVPVNTPGWLMGNVVFMDDAYTYTRIFVLFFAILIIIFTWLLLTKTPLGLLIRAVMQNREMASCVGVRTARVNMMTFAFGSGLAGLAGAFLAQIGNVGPNLGQAYIIDCFMTVVVGGVGNIIGTVVSALSIGLTDKTLEQMLGNPVIGKITVLFAIILFLQIRPGGLFPSKGRGLED